MNELHYRGCFHLSLNCSYYLICYLITIAIPHCLRVDLIASLNGAFLAAQFHAFKVSSTDIFTKMENLGLLKIITVPMRY